MNIVKQWMRAATPEEQELMAKAIGTTRGMLYQYSNAKTTKRHPSAERAAAFERASKVMHRQSRGRLPLIYRTDLAEACRTCEFAQKCLGPKAVRSDFPIVTEDQLEGSGND